MIPRRGFMRRAVSPQLEEDTQFYPTIYDVLKVRHILLWKVTRNSLPVEVVDMVVDAAEYWPSVEARMGHKRSIQKDVDEALLRTSPLCYDETLDTSTPRLLPHRTAHPCRKIVFQILSRDQGGSGREDPYTNSWTWLDADVIHNAHEPAQREVIEMTMNPINKVRGDFQPDDPLLCPGVHKLQSNRAHQSEPRQHTIIWHYQDSIQAGSSEAIDIEQTLGRGRATLDGKEVREMEIGDSIMIWGRARFPGWVNYVYVLSARVFWAI